MTIKWKRSKGGVIKSQCGEWLIKPNYNDDGYLLKLNGKFIGEARTQKEAKQLTEPTPVDLTKFVDAIEIQTYSFDGKQWKIES